MAAAFALSACTDPLAGPVDLFHDLEGGQIAQNRPPPPGVGQPYPKLGTVPARPVMPDPAFRRSLQAQLLAERDRTERVAADQPIGSVPPPPPKQLPPTQPPPTQPTPTPLPPPTAGVPGANATLATADAPPAPAALPPAAPLGTVTREAATPDAGPATNTPLTLAGAPMDMGAAPTMPDAPPAPATFEGVAAEPAPTPRPIPARLTGPPTGTAVFFGDGSAALAESQRQTLREFAGHRGRHEVEIMGLGEAVSDTPDGQATAVALALARARAVADALQGMRVPQDAMLLSADAFGRGAVLRLLP